MTAVLFLLPVSAPAHADPAATVDRYLALTSVSPHCTAPKAGSEIVVCGRRRADRWRVPFLLKEAGDPSIQNVPAERAGLIPTRTPCQDRSIFLVGCGKGVGLSMTVGLGAGAGGTKVRPIAD